MIKINNKLGIYFDLSISVKVSINNFQETYCYSIDRKHA